jgi:anti-sigma B factor antagonist
MSCRVSVRQAGNISIVDLDGRVTLREGASQMRDAIKQLAQEGAKNILVNFQDVSYLDSAALGELVSAHVSVTNAGGRIKLMHVPSVVKHLMQVTRIDTVFGTYEDEEPALESFTSEGSST